MSKKQEIIIKIESLLKEKEVSIRNKNAIEQFVDFIGLGKLNNLYNITCGVEDKLEFERHTLTLNELLNLIEEFDKRLNSIESKDKNNKINIILEDIFANGNVTGFEGKTSDPIVKELFSKNPMDIKLKNISAGGDVAGMKLSVDDEAELKQPLNIQNDDGEVNFNPAIGKVIFGKKLD